MQFCDIDIIAVFLMDLKKYQIQQLKTKMSLHLKTMQKAL